MGRYLLYRLMTGLGIIILVSTCVFILVRITGDPANALLPNYATKEDYQILHRELGLDKAIYVQYVIFIRNLAIGNLGISAKSRVPVIDMLIQRAPNSMKLAAVAMLMVICIAFPLGIMAALNRGKLLDWVARMIAALGQSLPVFWLGLILIQFMSIHLKLFPVAGMGGFSSFILPAFSEAFFAIAGTMRLLRSSMIEVLNSDYIRMARIKGVSEIAVIWKHALKNALIPVTTYSGMYFALLIISSVIVETVFSWPGIGRMLWEGVLSRDFVVVQSAVFLIIVLVVIVNLIVDIMYLYIDPRIRFQKE